MLAAATKLRILFITYPVRLSNVLRILRSALWPYVCWKALALGPVALTYKVQALASMVRPWH